jgi:outer membrane protein TolC
MGFLSYASSHCPENPAPCQYEVFVPFHHPVKIKGNNADLFAKIENLADSGSAENSLPKRRSIMGIFHHSIAFPSTSSYRRAWRILKALFVIAVAAGLAGCVTTDTLSQRVSDSPRNPWKPPAALSPRPAEQPAPKIPAELQSSKQGLTLENLVDIGLTNNPQTRLAWNAARSAAAALGSAQSSYFPRIEATANAARQKAAFAGGKFIVDQTTLNPLATLSFLLFDFGGRKAATDSARETLQAANWTQNAAIQNVILLVEKSYYQYLAAKALLKAQEASLKGAQANHDAARERQRAGVATVADVLQAKTALSSTELNLVTAQGLVQTLHGVLANALGLFANASFEIADEPAEAIPVEEFSKQVDACIKDAETRRPDLAASQALVTKAQAQIRKAQSDRLPNFTLNSNYGRVYYQGQAISNEQFTIAVLLDIPIFSGFQRDYQLLQARADAETAGAQMEKLEQDIALQVWTSFYGVKTSEQKIRTAQDLLASAEKSYEVALGRYKEGVGSILDLLTAQSVLENGRGQAIQARTEWFLSLVQFTHDTGTLGAPGTASNPGF